MSSQSFSESEPILTPASIEGSYRPLSKAAVATFVIGLFSILAFSTPYFWFIPIVGLLFGALTIWRIEPLRQELAGHMLAMLGTFFCLVIGASAITKYGVETYMITNEVTKFADEYIDHMLTNKVGEAFRMTQRPNTRNAVRGDLDQLIVRNEPAYRRFYAKNPYTVLAGKLQTTQVTRRPVDHLIFQSMLYNAAFEYIITIDDVKHSLRVLVRGGSAPEWTGREWWIEEAKIEPIH